MADHPFSAPFLERFEVGRRLGAGAMGTVWAARDRKLDRQVAVKVVNPGLLDDEGRARFKEEARVSALLRHEGIVTLFEAGTDGELPYLVFELVSGFSLRRYLTSRGRLTVRKTLKLAKRMAEALAYAHAQGVVHRDIKPDNVLVAGPDSIKLADFGIARALSQRSCKTKTGMVLGTVAYMAPEQISEQEVTPAADLYALGVVMYECLTGEQPFRGSTLEVAAAQIRDLAPPIPDVRLEGQPEVRRLVAWCLEKDPLRRIPSADELVKRLEGLLDPSSASAAGTRLAPSAAPSDDDEALLSYPGDDPHVLERLARAAAESPRTAAAERSAAAPGRSPAPFVAAAVLLLALGVALVRCSGGPSGSLPYEPVELRLEAGAGRLEATWQSSRPYPSRLEFRLEGAPAWRSAPWDPAPSTAHRVAVTDLPPGRYEVRVVYPDQTSSLTVTTTVGREPPVGGLELVRASRERLVVRLRGGGRLTATARVLVATGVEVEAPLAPEPDEGPDGAGLYRAELDLGHRASFLGGSEVLVRWSRPSGSGQVRGRLPGLGEALVDRLAEAGLERRFAAVASRATAEARGAAALALLREVASSPLPPAVAAFAPSASAFFRRDGPVSLEDRVRLFSALEAFVVLDQMVRELAPTDRPDVPEVARAESLRGLYVPRFQDLLEACPSDDVRAAVLGAMGPERAPGEGPESVVVATLGEPAAKVGLPRVGSSHEWEVRLAPGALARGTSRERLAVLAVRYRVIAGSLYLRCQVNEGPWLVLAAAGRAERAWRQRSGEKMGPSPLVEETFRLPAELLAEGAANRFRFVVALWPNFRTDTPMAAASIEQATLRLEGQ